MPTKIEVERMDPPGPRFISMSSLITYPFPARGAKPPVVMKWYERGTEVPKPKCREADKALPEEGGAYMEGSTDTIFHAGMRPNSPQMLSTSRFNELKSTLKELPRIPGVGGGPIEEWYRAIKGGPMPGSNFDYSAKLTEMVPLGALAQRSGETIEWDAKNMRVKGKSKFDAWVNGRARKDWDYGLNISRSGKGRASRAQTFHKSQVSRL